MYPNGNFAKYYKDEYDAIKPSTLTSDKLTFSDTIKYGLTSLLYLIAKRLNLFEILQNSFDSYNPETDNLIENILNLACSFITFESLSLVNYPFFARENLILGGEILDESTMESLINNIDKKHVYDFMVSWVNPMFLIMGF